VADRRIVRLIRKWLKAGISEDGLWSETDKGTPQRAVVPGHFLFNLARHSLPAVELPPPLPVTDLQENPSRVFSINSQGALFLLFAIHPLAAGDECSVKPFRTATNTFDVCISFS
jgi:hypothetical protein